MDDLIKHRKNILYKNVGELLKYTQTKHKRIIIRGKTTWKLPKNIVYYLIWILFKSNNGINFGNNVYMIITSYMDFNQKIINSRNTVSKNDKIYRYLRHNNYRRNVHTVIRDISCHVNWILSKKSTKYINYGKNVYLKIVSFIRCTDISKINYREYIGNTQLENIRITQRKDFLQTQYKISVKTLQTELKNVSTKCLYCDRRINGLSKEIRHHMEIFHKQFIYDAPFFCEICKCIKNKSNFLCKSIRNRRFDNKKKHFVVNSCKLCTIPIIKKKPIQKRRKTLFELYPNIHEPINNTSVRRRCGILFNDYNKIKTCRYKIKPNEKCYRSHDFILNI